MIRLYIYIPSYCLMCCENTLKQYSPFSPFPPLYVCHELDFVIYVTYIQYHWLYFCFFKTIKIRKIALYKCHLFLFSYFPFFCVSSYTFLPSIILLSEQLLLKISCYASSGNALSLSLFYFSSEKFLDSYFFF